MFKALFIATLILSSVSLYSQEVDQSHVITSVSVNRIEVEPLIDLTIPTNPVDEVAMYVDGLIAIGKKIWTIVDAGRPIINTTGFSPSISVLPALEGTDAKTPFYELANWSAPRAVSFRVSYKNGFDNEVVGFNYTVFFQYGGDYNGKGKYIANLKVQASQIYAAWGFNFDASSELTGLANVGSRENPIASAIIEVSYKVKGLVNEVRNWQTFYVTGDGEIKILLNN
jgi:hypothetical protein